MSQTRNIVIGANGVVQYMHTDKLDLSSLGARKVERASDIRFNDETQLWDIWFRVGGDFVPPQMGSHAGFAFYDDAREYEIRVMETAMAIGCPPTKVP